MFKSIPINTIRNVLNSFISMSICLNSYNYQAEFLTPQLPRLRLCQRPVDAEICDDYDEIMRLLMFSLKAQNSRNFLTQLYEQSEAFHGALSFLVLKRIFDEFLSSTQIYSIAEMGTTYECISSRAQSRYNLSVMT